MKYCWSNGKCLHGFNECEECDYAEEIIKTIKGPNLSSDKVDEIIDKCLAEDPWEFE